MTAVSQPPSPTAISSNGTHQCADLHRDSAFPLKQRPQNFLFRVLHGLSLQGGTPTIMADTISLEFVDPMKVSDRYCWALQSPVKPLGFKAPRIFRAWPLKDTGLDPTDSRLLLETLDITDIVLSNFLERNNGSVTTDGAGFDSGAVLGYFERLFDTYNETLVWMAMAQAGDEPTTMEPQSDYTLRPPYRANIETVDSYTVSSEARKLPVLLVKMPKAQLLHKWEDLGLLEASIKLEMACQMQIHGLTRYQCLAISGPSATLIFAEVDELSDIFLDKKTHYQRTWYSLPEDRVKFVDDLARLIVDSDDFTKVFCFSYDIDGTVRDCQDSTVLEVFPE